MCITALREEGKAERKKERRKTYIYIYIYIYNEERATEQRRRGNNVKVSMKRLI